MRRFLALAFALALLCPAQPAHAEPSPVGVGVGAPPAAITVSALDQSHVPFIIASCTVGANGALTGITTQAVAWPNAYMYFPANTLTTNNVAGFYFVQFSTTAIATAPQSASSGQPFQYVGPGNPAVPPSLSAGTWTAGGNVTAPTTEVAGPQFTIPGNMIGPNGSLRYLFHFQITNNVNAKTGFMRLGTGGTGGTLIWTRSLASLQSVGYFILTANGGLTNSQSTGPNVGFGGTSTTAPNVETSIDTTQPQTLSFTFQLSTNTDTLALVFAEVDLRYAP